MQDLKPQLSAVVAEAEAGQTVVITRHGKAVAQLGPADSPAVDPPYVHRGKLVGQPWPPAIPTGLGAKRILDALNEDRGDR